MAKVIPWYPQIVCSNSSSSSIFISSKYYEVVQHGIILDQLADSNQSSRMVYHAGSHKYVF